MYSSGPRMADRSSRELQMMLLSHFHSATDSCEQMHILVEGRHRLATDQLRGDSSNQWMMYQTDQPV